MAINAESVAIALAHLFPNKSFKAIEILPEVKSHTPGHCIWMDVCQHILKFKDNRALKKYVRNCYDVFRKHKEQVRENFENLIERRRGESDNHAAENEAAESENSDENIGLEENDVDTNSTDKNDYNPGEDAEFKTETGLEEGCFAQNEERGGSHEDKEEKMTEGDGCDQKNNAAISHDYFSLDDDDTDSINTEYNYEIDDIPFFDNNAVHFSHDCNLNYAQDINTNSSDNESSYVLDESKENFQNFDNIRLKNIKKSKSFSTIDQVRINPVVDTFSKESRKDSVPRKLKSFSPRTTLCFQDDDFIIPKEFWMENICGDEKNKLGLNWTHSFYTYFSKHPKYHSCSLSMHLYHLNPEKNGSKKKLSFYANASCQNVLCTSFRFQVIDPITIPFVDTTVNVYRLADIKHDPHDITRRLFSGGIRGDLARQLENKSPCVMAAEVYSNASPAAMKNGNYTGVPTLQILQKISSENQTKKDLHPHPLVNLEKLEKVYKEKWPGRLICGYLHGAFGRFAWTERQALYLLSLPKDQRNVFLDATGTIVADLDEHEKPMYYYALILPGSKEPRYGPMPIAEFTTEQHTVPQITHFLSTYYHIVLQLSPGSHPVFRKIETDFSLALITSIINAINGTNLLQFLDDLYSYATNPNSKSLSCTIVHICSSHTIKTIIKTIKKYLTNFEHRAIAKILSTLMIHCCNMDSFVKVWKKFMVIFGIEYHTPELNEYLQEFIKADTIQTSCGSDSDDESNSEPEEESKIEDDSGLIQLLIEEEEKNGERESIIVDGSLEELNHDLEQEDKQCGYGTARSKTKFRHHFKKIHEDFEQQAETNRQSRISQGEEVPLNPYYNENLFKYFLNFLIPYVPLWSAIILSTVGLTRDSDASIENYFKILKHHVAKQRKRIPVGRFFQMTEYMIDKWLLQREFAPGPTRRQKANRKRKMDAESLSTETWKPEFKKSKHSNRYFDFNKTLHSMMTEVDGLKPTSSENLTNREAESLPSKQTGVNGESPALNADTIQTKTESPKFDVFAEKKVEKNIAEEMRNVDNITVEHFDDDKESIENMEERGPMKSEKLTNEYPFTFDAFDGDAERRFLQKNIDYPPQFPEMECEIARIRLRPSDLRKLGEGRWINDNMIDAFFKTLEVIGNKNGIRVLSWNYLYASHLMRGEISSEMDKWLQRTPLEDYDAWLLPIHTHGNHWSLLVIVFYARLLLYLDSSHGLPPTLLIDSVMSLISTLRRSRQERVRKTSEWHLCAPESIPKQDPQDGNCGIHVCLWAYVICSRSLIEFDKTAMNTVRRGMAIYLTKFPQSFFVDSLGMHKKRDRSKHTKKPIELKKLPAKLETSRFCLPQFSNVFELCANIGALIDAAQ